MVIDLAKYKLSTSTGAPAAAALDLNKYKVAPAAPSPDQTSAQQFSPSFPAKTGEGALPAAAKVVGNIPSSAVQFTKNLASFLNPVKTVQTAQDIGTSLAGAEKDIGGMGKIALETAKEIPHTAYKTLVPKFVQDIVSGNTEEAQRTVENDPVGQILPLIMLARGAAQKIGKGAEFDAGITKVASPVTKIGSIAQKGAGNLAAQVVGASTGSGASSVKAAAEGSPAFVAAMRGKINPDEVVSTAQDALQTIKDNRRSVYLGDLQRIGENKKSIDISPIHDELNTQLKNFGVKIAPDGGLDFSRSSIANNGSARADVQGVYDTLKNWGSKAGDRTPVGLDTLKKQMSDFYSPSGSARAFVQAVNGKLSKMLKEQVPGYDEMTQKYQSASSLLDDIKSATGLGGKAKVDTVFTKLTTAMKADKELRLEILNTMSDLGKQPDLLDKIAGVNMQSFIPKGLVGRGIDVATAYQILHTAFSAKFLPMVLATSPRVVGEFVNALGIGARKARIITNALNTIGTKAAILAPAATVQQNQSLGQKLFPNRSTQTSR